MGMKDSRGQESKTLSFVTITWLVMLGKFAVAGVVFKDIITFADMGAGEFGLGVSAVLGIWLGREWTEKVSKKNV